MYFFILFLFIYQLLIRASDKFTMYQTKVFYMSDELFIVIYIINNHNKYHNK